MDKKLIGIVGALSALGVLDAGTAAAVPLQPSASIMQAQSYADLLEPIPNAVALLQVSDAEQAAGATDTDDQAVVTLVQYHHHHHNHWRRQRYHHHHSHWRRWHHHHHHQYRY